LFLGRFIEARQVFDHMLWLNPSDDHGVRFLIDEVKARTVRKDSDAGTEEIVFCSKVTGMATRSQLANGAKSLTMAGRRLCAGNFQKDYNRGTEPVCGLGFKVCLERKASGADRRSFGSIRGVPGRTVVNKTK
jgi:hypothetical protein